MAEQPRRYSPNPTPCGRNRREFLWEVGGGFAGLALIDLLTRDGFFEQTLAADSRDGAAAEQQFLAPKAPHFPVKAKHVVFLFMNGAPSQVDTFDYKPALTKYNGSPYRGDVSVGSNNRPLGYLMQSGYPLYSSDESSYPWTRAVGGEDRVC